jgi:hypothetical protein
MMKKTILIFIFLISISTQLRAQWDYVSETNTTFILYGMSFPPGQNNIGYACGMKYTFDADGIIIKTTDGGDNWTPIHPSTGDIDGLQGI